LRAEDEFSLTDRVAIVRSAEARPDLHLLAALQRRAGIDIVRGPTVRETYSGAEIRDPTSSGSGSRCRRGVSFCTRGGVRCQPCPDLRHVQRPAPLNIPTRPAARPGEGQGSRSHRNRRGEAGFLCLVDLEERRCCAAPCQLHTAATAAAIPAAVLGRVHIVLQRMGRVWGLALAGSPLCAFGERQHDEERGEPSAQVHRFLRSSRSNEPTPLGGKRKLRYGF
jgi:hypothetical protein